MRIAAYVGICVASAAVLGRATRSFTGLPISLRAAITSVLLSWTPSSEPLHQIAHYIEPSILIFSRYFFRKTYIAEYHFFAFAALLTLCLTLLTYWHFAQPNVSRNGEVQ